MNFINFSALHLATENGYSDIVQLLLKQGDIDVNSKTIINIFF